MNPSYQPRAIESAAQSAWTAADAYRVTEDARDAQGGYWLFLALGAWMVRRRQRDRFDAARIAGCDVIHFP